MPLIAVLMASITIASADLYQECAKLLYPNNYLDQLPPLQLPYLGSVPIPFNVPKIKPSQAAKTRAVSVVTKYVYRNPVCVKYSKKKAACKPQDPKHRNNMEQLVTKEYFVKDRAEKIRDGDRDRKRGEENVRREYDNRRQRVQDLDDYDDRGEDEDYHDVHIFLQSSENPRPFTKDNRKTPSLSQKQIHDLLIEDRLDQLETILPQYTRRRVYETSTITVTKVISNKRAMATLTVKNCIPQGYEICSPKIRKRVSKVAQSTDDSNESNYFG